MEGKSSIQNYYKPRTEEEFNQTIFGLLPICFIVKITYMTHDAGFTPEEQASYVATTGNETLRIQIPNRDRFDQKGYPTELKRVDINRVQYEYWDWSGKHFDYYFRRLLIPITNKIIFSPIDSDDTCGDTPLQNFTIGLENIIQPLYDNTFGLVDPKSKGRAKTGEALRAESAKRSMYDRNFSEHHGGSLVEKAVRMTVYNPMSLNQGFGFYVTYKELPYVEDKLKEIGIDYQKNI